jgi:hypothetical protein
MEINNNMKVGAVNGVITAKRSPAVARASGATDPFASSTALESALKSLPDSRPEAVDHARELINDPSYPSADVVKKLSGFLADKLTANAE